MSKEIEHTDVKPLDMLWGATAIAKAIGVNRRKAYYLLENGLLPAKKVGDSWCASRSALLRRLVADEAA